MNLQRCLFDSVFCMRDETTRLFAIRSYLNTVFQFRHLSKCAPYKLPCRIISMLNGSLNYFQRTIRNQPTTAITVKSYLLRIKFFINPACRNLGFPLGRKSERSSDIFSVLQPGIANHPNAFRNDSPRNRASPVPLRTLSHYARRDYAGLRQPLTI